MNNHQGSHDLDDLEPPLVRAVQTIRAETLPAEAVARVIDRARRLDVASPGRRPMAIEARPCVHPWAKRRIVAWGASGAAALAACLLLAIFFLSDGTSVLFAEMLAALAGRPWVHSTTTYTGDMQTATSESWVSTANRCAAIKFGHHRKFIDMETGIAFDYDAAGGMINRTAWLHQEAGRATEAQLPGLLDRLIADKADSRQLFPGERVVKAARSEEEQDGKKWLVYLIHLEGAGDATRNRTLRVRLDRASRLPQSWEERQAGGTVAMTRFDYPDTGPRNIYELDVPRTATLVDRVPKGDLALIVAAQQADRKRFDAYDAIVVQSAEGTTPNYDYLINLDVRRVRRKGSQYRVDRLLSAKEGLTVPTPGTDMQPVKDEQGVTTYRFADTPPASEIDMQRWWKENRDRYWCQPVVICDGETTHIYTSTTPKRSLLPGRKPNLSVVESSHYPLQPPAEDSPVVWPQLMPEQCCRPHLWPSDKTSELEVDPDANDGPPGTVRVIVTKKSEPGAGEIYRYWFDPQRDYALQKQITRAFDSRTNTFAYPDTEQYDEFAQSPSGMWYPRLVRRVTSDDSKSRQTTRFFVDFGADINSDLFRPVSEH